MKLFGKKKETKSCCCGFFLFPLQFCRFFAFPAKFSVYSGRKQKNTRVPALGTLVQYIISTCPVAAGCAVL